MRKLPGTTVEEKLALNGRPDGGCFRWTGAHTPTGYGQLKVERKARAVHQLAYELAHGPIPDGYEIDHLCRVRDCYRVDHLEVVTHQENLHRMVRAETCPNGHPRTPENRKPYKHRGVIRVKCRRCHNDRRNARRRLGYRA